MGVTYVNVLVRKSARSKRTERVECLVDSGAHYSAIPRKTLQKLGIRPDTKESFILADGSKIERELGAACFELKGRSGTSMVIFGEEGDAALLGILTLETLGLMLDPLKRELRQLPLLLM
jgi:predicted aspartyl protease